MRFAVGQIWQRNEYKPNPILEIITNIYSQSGHEYITDSYGSEHYVESSEDWVCGINNLGETFNCMLRQFKDEICYNDGTLLSEYHTWQEAVNSQEFKKKVQKP